MFHAIISLAFLALAVSTIVIVMMSVRVIWSVRRECPYCDYDLHGHPGWPDRCPECGHVLDAADRFTLKVRRNRRKYILAVMLLITLSIAAYAAGLVLLHTR